MLRLRTEVAINACTAGTSAIVATRIHTTAPSRSRRRFLQFSTTALTPPHRRRQSRFSLERTAERSLRFITHLRADRRHLRRSARQLLRSELQPPPREILHRRNSNELREALGEHGSR